MCTSQKSMSPPAVLPPPPDPPRDIDPAVTKAKNEERRLATLAAGRASTILTGPQGLEAPANTTAIKKTVLGG